MNGYRQLGGIEVDAYGRLLIKTLVAGIDLIELRA